MALYDDDDAQPARRRENIMQRRLRKARGEDVDDDLGQLDDLDDDDYDYEPRGYSRLAPPAAQGGGCAQAVLYLVLGGLAVVLVAVFFLSRATSSIGNIFAGVQPTFQAMVATPTTTLGLSSAAVVRQVQQLNRLETTSFTIEKVIEAGVEGNILYDLLYKDQLLLIAHGNVVAGVDLSKLRESDVTVGPDGRSLRLRLPPAEILSASLDNSKTRIYRRDQAPLADNKDLETQARQAAEAEILKAACEDGILQQATEDSREAVEQLFQLAEFQQVTIESSSPAACVAPGGPGATPGP
jgi:hypothetical protein